MDAQLGTAAQGNQILFTLLKKSKLFTLVFNERWHGPLANGKSSSKVLVEIAIYVRQGNLLPFVRNIGPCIVHLEKKQFFLICCCLVLLATTN